MAASLAFRPLPNPNFRRSSGIRPHILTNNVNLSKHPQDTRHNPNIIYKSLFHRISTLCKQGLIQSALDLIHQMELNGLLIGPEIYGEVLQGCVYERDVSTGRQIHGRLVKNGVYFTKNEYVETKLLVFYAKCDILEIANSLFDDLRLKNVFSWTAIIGLRCRMGFNEEALMGVCEMLKGGVLADNFLVPNALKACGALQWIGFGKEIHGYSVKMGLICCVFVLSSLVDMYGKCGSLNDARRVFDEMPERNVIAWNSMIGGYVQNGLNEEALSLFLDMRLENVEPSRVSLTSFLTALANLGAVEEGKQAHGISVKLGFELDNISGSSILNFYSKVGLMDDAELVFNRMIEKDIVTWNLLISRYVHYDQSEKALGLCYLMRLENLRFDSIMLASILSACSKTRDLQLGKEAHCYCIRNSLDSNVDVASRIVDMYKECGRIDDARCVFNYTKKKDLVTWNTLLTAFTELGLIGEALKLFYQMQLESVPPNAISWNAVIMGFVRNGQLKEAKDMLSQMVAVGVQPNLATFSILITGLVQSGSCIEALSLFQKMLECGIQPDSGTITLILSICEDEVGLQYRRAIHGYILRNEL